MKIELIKRNIYINQYVLAICYKFILDLSYVFFEAKYYGYIGFQYEPNILRILTGWGIYFFVFLLIKSEKNNLAVLFTYMIFALSMAPFVTLYQFSDDCKLWMVILQMASLIYIHFIASKCRLVGFKIKTIPYYSFFIMEGMTFYIIIFALYSLHKLGIPELSLLGFEKISEVRAAAELSTLDSIIINVSCRVIVPLYILLNFYEKKFVKTLLGTIVQIYIYSVTGFKTFLFIPLVMIGLIIFRKLDLKKVKKKFFSLD